MRTDDIRWVHTLIIGSGAAGLNAALQLWQAGVKDILIVTEGLDRGTSINTGSDKQTYYKLSLYGEDEDSPYRMAETYYSGGSMHGDLALVEAANSVRAFFNLVNIGVPFPTDRYGQYLGYKTDHDPKQRATSIGPYTSQEMCRALIRQIRFYNIPVEEGSVVYRLLVFEQEDTRRVGGAIAVDREGKYRFFCAENVILAVGGPGGLYETSVYPSGHTGGIGLALFEGAVAQNLPESQYGLASIKYRWNVSGSYMQVIPRFISYATDGVSDEREFLNEYFDNPQEIHRLTFLKGYEWPFDSRKLPGGSSIIDVLVYYEIAYKNRRVFLDFRQNPIGFQLDKLDRVAKDYLIKSKAINPTPVERLITINPSAYSLYKNHGIDLMKDPLEIAVCAQHNNGGLAGNIWWESLNIKHLFPVGEVNGSHGVVRPGGAALNAGQVGSLRAANYIANRYMGWSIHKGDLIEKLHRLVDEEYRWLEKCRQNDATTWKKERIEFQRRMTYYGAHIRATGMIHEAVRAAKLQFLRIMENGCGFLSNEEIPSVFQTRYLCFSHWVYLEAIKFHIESGVGSRGSMIVLDTNGRTIHPHLPNKWKYRDENPLFKEKVMMTEYSHEGLVKNYWIDRRPIPPSQGWFETGWADYLQGRIYQEE